MGAASYWLRYENVLAFTYLLGFVTSIRLTSHRVQACALVITVMDEERQKLKLVLHGSKLTIADVKKQVAEQMGIPVERQRLLFKGMVLSNCHLLSSYGIHSRAQLRLDGATFRKALR
jgi:hypothetical protein